MAGNGSARLGNCSSGAPECFEVANMLGIYFKRALFCIVSQDFTNRHYMLQPMVDQSSKLQITLGWVWKLFMLMNMKEVLERFNVPSSPLP
jgi:hypothetical protein